MITDDKAAGLILENADLSRQNRLLAAEVDTLRAQLVRDAAPPAPEGSARRELDDALRDARAVEVRVRNAYERAIAEKPDDPMLAMGEDVFGRYVVDEALEPTPMAVGHVMQGSTRVARADRHVNAGAPVAIRTVDGDRTYLGVYLGEIATGFTYRHAAEVDMGTKLLGKTTVHASWNGRVNKRDKNPAVFLPGGVLACLHCGETYKVNMPIPIGLLAALNKTWGKDHRTHKLTARGKLCHYCLTFGHPSAECPKLDYHGDWEAWVRGPDTGMSSLVLCATIVGRAEFARCFPTTSNELGTHHPHDPEDFGRCYRLLKAIPGFRELVGRAARLGGAWECLVSHWDELEALYEEELPTGAAPKLYERMQQIIHEEASHGH